MTERLRVKRLILKNAGVVRVLPSLVQS